MARRVAVIGASNDRHKFGNRAVRAFVRLGYDVYPVHPTEPEVEGLKAWASVKDVPVELDMVTIYVPPHVGIGLLDDIAAVRPAEVWLNPGSDDAALVERARSLGLDPILACSIMAVGESPYRD